MNKKQIVTGCAVALAAMTGVAHAEEVTQVTQNSKSEQKTIPSNTMDNVVTQTEQVPTEQEVNSTKSNLEQVNKQVFNQASVVGQAEAAVAKGESDYKKALESSTEASIIASKSTPEGITNATNELASEKKNLQIAINNKSSIDNKIANQTSSVNDQQTKVNEVNNLVKQNAQEVREKQSLVSQKQSLVDGSNKSEVIAKADSSAKQVVEDEQAVKQAKLSLTNAIASDSQKQSLIDSSSKKLQELNEQRVTANNSLTVLKDEAAKASQEQKAKQSLVNDKQIVVSNLKDEIANHNTIKVPDSYGTALKTFYENGTVSNQEVLVRVAQSGNSINVYKSNNVDKNRVVNDINNLTVEQKNELTLFTTDLINQVRQQIGTPKVVANVNAISFANDVARNYTNAVNHDVPVIVAQATKYGLNNENNWYENLSMGHFDPTQQVTMDSLKQGIFSTLVSMLFKDGETWGHATDIAGVRYSRENIVDPASKYVGVDVNSINYKLPSGDSMLLGQIHILGVADSDIVDKSKFNTVNNLVERDLEKELAVAEVNLSVSNNELSKAQLATNAAQKAVEVKLSEVNTLSNSITDVETDLENANRIESQTNAAQLAYDLALKKLAKDKEINDANQSAVKQLSSDIQTKLAELEKAKAVLKEKENELSVLKAEALGEFNKLQTLKLTLQNLKNSSNSAQNNIEKLKVSVKDKEFYVETLKNAPKILFTAESKLKKVTSELAQLKSKLQEEINKLNDLKIKQKAAKENYQTVLNSYKAYIEKQSEVKRQSELVKQIKEIEAKGGIPKPIFNKEGKVISYVEKVVKVEKLAEERKYSSAGVSQTYKVSKLKSEVAKVGVEHKTLTWNNNSTTLPNTGDESHNSLWVNLLLFLSSIGLVVYRKKEVE